MEEIDNCLKEVSFNSNSKLREKILVPSLNNQYDKENEDVFNKIWSCHQANTENHNESFISNHMSKLEANDEGIGFDRCAASAQKPSCGMSFASANYETTNSASVAP